jgi:ABC-type Fe3+/spermidine/putrescine transport system ATPase subunit
LEGEIREAGEQRLVARTGIGDFEASPRAGIQRGMKVWVGIRPEALDWAEAGTNVIEAELRQTNYLGEIEEYVLAVGDISFKCFVQNPERILAPGTRLKMRVRPDDLLVLPR